MPGLLLGLLALLVWPHPGFPHGLGVSYSTVSLEASPPTAQIRMQAHDVLLLLGADPQADPKSEIHLRAREIALYCSNRYALDVDGREHPPAAITATFQDEGLGWALVEATYPPLPPGSVFGVRSTVMLELDAAHVHMVRVKRAAGVDDELVLKQAARGELPLGRGDSALWPQLARYLALGVEHIFLGYDHILFLIALLLLAAGFLDLVKIVSSFTAAHTLTLLLATLDVVRLPGNLVECVIALSIIYVAMENFFVTDARGRWKLTFLFGLVHGFGFSSALQETGLPARGLVACLLCFNGGVELGQLAIVGMLFPLIRLSARWRHHHRVVRQGGSAAILLFGLYWFFERAFGG
ncbi:MAG: HupE/UreJ family protein [Candidatus Wallbacteria bacterium]|nr:HupE/UreJ family protein [Candidatus Wallbacteria bacterium]